MQIAIIGGGAAGCFAAINLARISPEANITLYEAAPKLLAKVAITGGGRCNLTNSFNEVQSTEAVYPRGFRLMKRLLKEFGNKDTMQWFEQEGVRLMTQDDQRVFPESQNAMEIVNTLTQALHKANVCIRTSCRIADITYNNSERPFTLTFDNHDLTPASFNCVLATTGGLSSPNTLSLFNSLKLPIVKPLPSLFSFCINDNSLTSLMGTAVENAVVKLVGTKLRAEGALLITHWGISGPATLKLSSYAARVLAEKNYNMPVSINWLGNTSEEGVFDTINNIVATSVNKKVVSVYPPGLNSRLWTHILTRSGISHERKFAEIGRKNISKLVATLTNDTYNIMGKNRFKDEFVTCGGIELSDVNPHSMQSRSVPGLFFAGELLDIDAVTGGFNLQAAWTTAYVAAKGIADFIESTSWETSVC